MQHASFLWLLPQLWRRCVHVYSAVCSYTAVSSSSVLLVPSSCTRKELVLKTFSSEIFQLAVRFCLFQETEHV